MRGAVDERAEEHQQPRHHEERGQQRIGDGFDQADGHVGAELELHEQHRNHAADRGEAARADLRDGLAERGDDGLADGEEAVLFLEVVAEDDRVVDGEGKL